LALKDSSSRTSVRKHYLLLSTRDPPAIQRIPWPSREESEDEEHVVKNNFTGHSMWMLNEQEFPWLADEDGELSIVTS